MSELIHTCYRVLDPERSVAFYEKLGFEEMRRMPIGDDATNVFMGLPGDGARLELTHNHDVDEPYDHGTGYGHIAMTVDDMDGDARAPRRGRASSRRSRHTPCARADPASASSATRTAIESNSSRRIQRTTKAEDG